MNIDGPKFSDSELLALAAIGRRVTDTAQRERQAFAIAEFVWWESQPSCSLVKSRRWSRAENARQQGIMRRRRRMDGNAA